MSRNGRTARSRAAALGAGVVVTALLAGCGGSSDLVLSGPNALITVGIPDGWHQVIDSANSSVPEMVAPITCMGRNEVACSTGLARIASFAAPSAQAAEDLIERAVLSGPGVNKGVSINQGPGKVGGLDGYRHRFEFTNPGATLTSEIASVLSGPDRADARGNRLYSVVLVWVSKKDGAPDLGVLDTIIDSVKVLPEATEAVPAPPANAPTPAPAITQSAPAAHPR